MDAGSRKYGVSYGVQYAERNPDGVGSHGSVTETWEESKQETRDGCNSHQSRSPAMDGVTTVHNYT